MSEITNIAVIGGGLMGAGIAQVFAVAGFQVRVYEPQADVRSTIKQRVHDTLQQIGCDTACVDLIQPCDSLEAAVSQADYVTEAAPEKLGLKQSIFADLEKLAPRHAILASNTSVIPTSHIAEGLETADRIVGTHWWNPPYLVPLVEVIQGANTSLQTIERTMQLMASLGKQPAHVRKDVPGFVGNRLQHALWREAIAMVAEGICDAQTVDTCVKNSFGLRLPVLGPLENADLVGLDLTLDIHNTIIPELDRSAGPNPYLKEKVSAGSLGFKSDEGFRTWTEDEKSQLRATLLDHLVKAQRS